MTSYISTESSVYHMEADPRIRGNILFSDGSSLQPTDGITTTAIVGNPLNLGYIEGVGTHARFRGIAGFVQISAENVMVVDRGNSYLREVNRESLQTSWYAGNGSCRWHQEPFGWYEQSFCYPSSNILDMMSPTQYFVTDIGYYSVRVFEYETNHSPPTLGSVYT